MKAFLAILVFVFSIVILVFGNLFWHYKINLAASEAKVAIASDTSYTSLAGGSNGASSDKPKNIKALTHNLPAKLQKKISKAYKQGQNIRIVIAGGDEIKGLAASLQKSVDEAYGAGFMQISEADLGNSTSLDIYNQKLIDNYVKAEPDILIYTPVLRNDIGQVSSSDSVSVVRLIHSELASSNPDLLFVIEPPNPIVTNQLIKSRVEKIASYAKQNQIPYLNHWSNWPSSASQLKGDLDSTGMLPNQSGEKIWSDSLAAYFTGKL